MRTLTTTSTLFPYTTLFRSKKLMNAFADGINYFMFKNPKVKPALLSRFKPWYPLLWTDGSIGAINTAGVTVNELQDFYTGKNRSEEHTSELQSQSNLVCRLL